MGKLRRWMREHASKFPPKPCSYRDIPMPVFLYFLRKIREPNELEEARRYENYAYILDIVHHDHLKPIAQLIGERYLLLLEAVIKPDAQIKPLDKVFVGRGERDIVILVLRRIKRDKLTKRAISNLPDAIHKIIVDNERIFITLINCIGYSIAYRTLHAYQLLPDLRRSDRKILIEELCKKPFKSFKDIWERCGIEPNKLINSLTKRIFYELEWE